MADLTSYQGIEVVEVDHEVKCRHPKFGYDPKRLATLTGASLLLLADETFLVVCDNCSYNGLTGHGSYEKPTGAYKSIIKQADSLLAHINAMHHPGGSRKEKFAAKAAAKAAEVPIAVERRKDTTSRYTEAEIEAIIRIWLKWRGSGEKMWTKKACDEVTRHGFQTQFGGPWHPDQLGSLVHNHMKKPRFLNLAPAPFDGDGLAEMVRESAAREGRTGTHLADNVRITERKGRYKHTPVDFAGIIEASEAAKQQEVETVPGADPVLNFVGAGGHALEPAPTMTLEVDAVAPVSPAPTTVPAPRPVAPTAIPEPQVGRGGLGDYEHVLDLDGMPVFRYKGKLMAGKPVKGLTVEA